MESSSAINYQIENSPEAACLIVNLQPLQKVFVKTSTLTAKDSSLEIAEIISANSSDMDSNFSIDYNLTINEIKAPKLPGSLYLFPDILGAIKHCSLNSQAGIITQIFSFLACSENIQLRIISSPIISFFSY
ncbi:MAG: AIM24 family protein [Crocosphaera sp.]